ncbi:MAG: penicillin-binding protein 2, partial [Xenococcaceae cyanobacterium MO_167.B52]|nr:penicillin-binding protein 2 [Xenococcaceae cyanobacterium MO_167.B52]
MISVSNNKQSDKERTVGRQFQSFLIMVVIGGIFFGGIGGRLAYLQLEQGAINRAKAKENRTRNLPKPPIRGNIFDRKGRVLATTRLSYSAYLWPKAQKQEDWSELKELLAKILEIPASDLQKRVEDAGYNYPSLIPIASNLNPTQLTAIAEYREQLKWVEIDPGRVRHYPHGQLAAHVLGYTGELNQQQLKQRRKDGYRLGDVMGKMGLEASFESLLRGKWGSLNLEVDGAGRVLQVLGETPAQAGQDITTTIDLDVQKAAESALGERKGAIVALNPQDGSVLAIASYPGFDPNI